MSREVHAVEVHRNGWTDEARAVCLAHGEDPHGVAWAQYDVIDIPLVRFGIMLTDEDGGHYLACVDSGAWNEAGHVHDDCQLAMTTRERAAVGGLPSWLTDPLIASACPP